MKLTALVTATLLASATFMAHALEVKPYSAAALDQLQKANQPVALHFHADWCPTCRAQDKSLATLKTEPGLAVTVLSVDYDAEKALKQQLGIRSQSTLVMFHGAQERGRSVGETTPDALRAALKSAL